MMGKWPLGRFLDGIETVGVPDALESSTVIQDFSKLEIWAEEMLQQRQMNSPWIGGLVSLEKRKLLGRRHREKGLKQLPEVCSERSRITSCSVKVSTGI